MIEVSNKNFLSGKKEIMAFLKISEPLFMKFKGLGMPILIVDGRYYANRANLAAWHQKMTAKPYNLTPDIPEDEL